MSLPDPAVLVISEAARINHHIAMGGTVHFSLAALTPKRRIVRATPEERRIRFDFADGGHRWCRCWSAAVDAGEGYTLIWKLILEDAA